MSLDSRAARPRGLRRLVRHLGVLLWGEPVYCLSCGHQDGYVTVDLPPGVFYLCGVAAPCGCECERTYGVPPEMVTRPDLDEAMVGK